MLRNLAKAALRRLRGASSAPAAIAEVPNFDAAFDHWSASPPHILYAICATPRSGSTLLCHGLWLSQIGGKPAEYFHYRRYGPLLDRWNCLTLSSRAQRLMHPRSSILRRSEDVLRAYCHRLMQWRTSENGVFGIKIHAWQWQRELAPRSLDELFPQMRCIFIRREDKLRQAISLVRARQTNQYRGSQPPERVPYYSKKAITAAIEELTAEEATWEHYFAVRHITPLGITYEELVNGYRRTVASVLQFAGAPPGADFQLPPPILQRQSDQLTEDWLDRYSRETT